LQVRQDGVDLLLGNYAVNPAEGVSVPSPLEVHKVAPENLAMLALLVAIGAVLLLSAFMYDNVSLTLIGAVQLFGAAFFSCVRIWILMLCSLYLTFSSPPPPAPPLARTLSRPNTINGLFRPGMPIVAVWTHAYYWVLWLLTVGALVLLCTVRVFRQGFTLEECH
jgi:hypothetical protein